MQNHRVTVKAHPAFTLAELLIALLILGVIATFTIPKVLQSQQNQQWKSGAKEAAAAMSAAYKLFLLNNTLASDTKIDDFISYLNYVKEDTSGIALDNRQGQGLASACNGGSRRCFVMHNGGVIHYQTAVNFGGTANTNAIGFMYDPDYLNNAATTDTPGKAIQLYIYTDGRITSVANLLTGTANSSGPLPGSPNGDPPWFSWD